MTGYTLNWTPPGNAFPISLATGGRYLVDRLGTPYPVFGDSAWWMPYNLSVADQKIYFADRVSRGFNATLVTAIEHDGTVNKPPRDFSSAFPFSKRLDGATYTGSPNGTAAASGSKGQFTADPYTTIAAQAPDFTQITAAYWQRMSDYVRLAASFNLTVFMFPCYCGFAGGDQGWMAEMVANDAVISAGGFAGQPYANASRSLLWNYGAFLATLLAGLNNLIFVHGGDFGSGGASGTFSAPQKAAVASVRAGMLSVPAQASKLHTAHWSRPSQASAISPFTFDLQSVYTNTTPADEARTAYASNLGPVFQIEGVYDQDSGSSAPYRQYLWWLYTSGATGFYGDASPSPGPIWAFNTTGGGWQSLLNSTGAQDASKIFALWNQIAWWTLAPTSTLVTANGSTTTNVKYVSFSIAVDGSLAVGYVPNAWDLGTFTLDMTQMRGSTTARWYNPLDGTFSGVAGSPLANTGPHVFTPPAAHADGKTDWILVLSA